MVNLLKKRWYVFIFLLIIGGIIYFKYSSDVASTEAKLKKIIVKREDLEDSISLSGKIDADEQTVLRFQTSGRLSWVGVKEGDVVKKYQGIASLDQRDVKNRLQKYLNTYSKTRFDYDQTKEDKQIKYIGGLSEDARREALRILDKTQFDLNNSVLDVELQNLSLEYSYLFTPIEGLVVRVDAPFAGLNITPSTAEFEIINPNTIYFSATADQLDVIKLKNGLKGLIVFDAYPDKNVDGEIETIGFMPKSGESGTVYEVKMHILTDDTSYQYRYGMTGDVNFILSKKNNVISIPANYVKTESSKNAKSPGKKYVWKFVNGQKVKTFVSIADEIDNDVIVTSGLQENDVVVD